MQQAAIGPGMAVFSKYREVRESKGTMSVHDALVLINNILDEILNHAESELDAHTRWAVAWFEQFGVKEGGEGAAADMYAELSADEREGVRDLCYRLYNTCERKGWSEEALGYNRLIAALPSINLKSQSMLGRPTEQSLFEE